MIELRNIRSYDKTFWENGNTKMISSQKLPSLFVNVSVMLFSEIIFWFSMFCESKDDRRLLKHST